VGIGDCLSALLRRDCGGPGDTSSRGAASTKDAQQATPAAASALRLTLEDSIARARKNSTQFQAAQTDAAIARQDRYQAAAALLPSVTYNNQALYTQSTARVLL